MSLLYTNKTCYWCFCLTLEPQARVQGLTELDYTRKRKESLRSSFDRLVFTWWTLSYAKPDLFSQSMNFLILMIATLDRRRVASMSSRIQTLGSGGKKADWNVIQIRSKRGNRKCGSTENWMINAVSVLYIADCLYNCNPAVVVK